VTKSDDGIVLAQDALTFDLPPLPDEAVEKAMKIIVDAILNSDWEESWERRIYIVVPWPDVHRSIELNLQVDPETAARLAGRAVVKIKMNAGLGRDDLGMDDYVDWPPAPRTGPALWLLRRRRDILAAAFPA
jgi:hypothetical protein